MRWAILEAHIDTNNVNLSSIKQQCWDSSVGIVSQYRLDDGVRSPAKAKDFSSGLYVQSSNESHPASYPMGNCVFFLGVKPGRVVTLTTHPIQCRG
jgi:hypothetical protein